MKKYSTREMRVISSKIILMKNKDAQAVIRKKLDSAQTAFDAIQASKNRYERRISSLHELLNEPV